MFLAEILEIIERCVSEEHLEGLWFFFEITGDVQEKFEEDELETLVFGLEGLEALEREVVK